ncbi:hypothetical protein V8E36_009225 [Tilletia maclaganii]
MASSSLISSPSPSKGKAKADDALVPKEQESPRKKLRFSSKEVLDLCVTRRGIKRFPDVVAAQEGKIEKEGAALDPQNRRWAAELYRAYVQENENSSAEFFISNNVDFEPHPPLDFCWTNGYVAGGSSNGPWEPHGCECDEDECDPTTCSCISKMHKLDPETWKSEFQDWFPYRRDGTLHEDVADNAVIWECNDSCGCSDSCTNRNVQFGRRYAIELFKTHNGRGWGLKAAEKIPARAFVICYTGELIEHSQIDKRGKVYDDVGLHSYLLYIDSWHVKIETLYRPINRHRKEIGKEPIAKFDSDEMKQHTARFLRKNTWYDPMLTVDAAFWGNISRYINHSCDPNLQIYPVCFGPESGFIIRPYLVFFAKKDIACGEELTFSYHNDSLDDEESQDTDAPTSSYGGTQSQRSRRTASSDDEADGDYEDAVIEQSASQHPRSLSTKGFKGKAERKKFQLAEGEQELNSIGAQRCLCGSTNCKGKFWK